MPNYTLSIEMMPVPDKDRHWTWRLAFRGHQTAFARGLVPVLHVPVELARADHAAERWTETGDRAPGPYTAVRDAVQQAIVERLRDNDPQFDWAVQVPAWYCLWPNNPDFPEADGYMLDWLKDATGSLAAGCAGES